MDKKKKDILFASILRLLKPLVRIMLRNGVPYGTFADLARYAYVDVARSEFGIEGRKTSTSRVSVLTGLSRKAVASISKMKTPPQDLLSDRYNRAARVISAWVRQSDYCNGAGEPLALPVDGDRPSFASLIREHSGDIPMRAVLDELLNVGAVTLDGNEKVRLNTRAYIPTSAELDKLHILGTDVADLIATIDINLKGAPPAPLYQRKVAYDNIPLEALQEFRALCGTRAQGLLEELDRWLAKHDRDCNPEVKGSGTSRTGVGIYYFEESRSEENPTRAEGAES